MEGVIYPEFPLISNVEFFCMYLLEHGPMHKNDLVEAFWKWRNYETRFNYYELFSHYGGMCGAPRRIEKQRLNFTVFVLPKKKGRNIALAPLGFRTALQAMERVKTLDKLTIDERTFYVYFKSPGNFKRVELKVENDYDSVYSSEHLEWIERPRYRVEEVRAKTSLGARRLAEFLESPYPGYMRHLVSKHKYDLTSKKLDSPYDKCHCKVCRTAKDKKKRRAA